MRQRGRLIGRTKGGMTTKLHAICDSQGRPLSFFVTAGQVSDYIGARALPSRLPDVKWLHRDRGYDADSFREALIQTAQPHRDHVWQAQGLEARGDTP